MRATRPIIVSLAIPLIVWAVAIALMSSHPSTDGLDLAQGAVTFRDRCGACHFLERGISTHHGPTLASIGAEAATRKPGMTAAQYLLESIVDPAAFVAPHNRAGMPQNIAQELSTEAVRNLIAFLAGRDAAPDFEEIRRLPIPARAEKQLTRIIRRDEMEIAERALREKASCLDCHSPYRNAEYQVVAPSLFGLGLTDPQQVRTSIVNPNATVSPAYALVSVVLTDGQTVTGRLIASADERIVLLEQNRSGQWVCRSFSSDEVERASREALAAAASPSPRSPMPTGFDQLLSERELDAIVTMIRQLN